MMGAAMNGALKYEILPGVDLRNSAARRRLVRAMTGRRGTQHALAVASKKCAR
jgi:hypothetical protein